MIDLLTGDALVLLRGMATNSAHMLLCSPPYWGLRDYNMPGQIGLEADPRDYIAKLVEVFREGRRVLRGDGTLWLNMGDSYTDGGRGDDAGSTLLGSRHTQRESRRARNRENAAPFGLGRKQLIGMPWRLAFALQEDGWYLRSDIIWCLSGGAWLYARTQKGEMPVMLKDLVRLDPATVKLWNGEKWTQVRSWTESRAERTAIEVVLRSGERVGCTAGHVWPTQRGNVRAEHLLVGDVIEAARLPEPEKARTPAYLSDDLLWLVGLYLAEGSRSGDTVQLALSADEQGWIPRIEAAARAVGATVSWTVSGGSLNVRVYGRVFVAVVEEYIGGRRAIDKHLRVPVWRLPDRALQLIIQGYLDGDAADNGARYRLGLCRNYSLERDLRTAAARLGATLTLNPSTAAYRGTRRPTFRGEWRWSRRGHHNEKSRGEVVWVRRSRARRFWDVEVADEPHLFALASGVLTHNSKPNPMPESVRDRPTKAHEYLFLFSKRARYFYDAKAIAEPVSEPRQRVSDGVGHVEKKIPSGWATDTDRSHREIIGRFSGLRRVPQSRARTNGKHAATEEQAPGRRMVESVKSARAAGADHNRPFGPTRNKRDVWVIRPVGFAGAHFATFPPELARLCILAGSSPRACELCGAPWHPVYGKPAETGEPGSGNKVRKQRAEHGGPKGARKRQAHLFVPWTPTVAGIVNWRRTCECSLAAGTARCLVVDPFGGSGTTGLEAEKLGRDSILIDLNPEYVAMAEARTATVRISPPSADIDMRAPSIEQTL